jgi:hypothetical protein
MKRERKSESKPPVLTGPAPFEQPTTPADGTLAGGLVAAGVATPPAAEPVVVETAPAEPVAAPQKRYYWQRDGESETKWAAKAYQLRSPFSWIVTAVNQMAAEGKIPASDTPIAEGDNAGKYLAITNDKQTQAAIDLAGRLFEAWKTERNAKGDTPVTDRLRQATSAIRNGLDVVAFFKEYNRDLDLSVAEGTLNRAKATLEAAIINGEKDFSEVVAIADRAIVSAEADVFNALVARAEQKLNGTGLSVLFVMKMRERLDNTVEARSKGELTAQDARNAVLDVLKKISAIQFVNREMEERPERDSRPRHDDRNRDNRGSRPPKFRD